MYNKGVLSRNAFLFYSGHLDEGVFYIREGYKTPFYFSGRRENMKKATAVFWGCILFFLSISVCSPADGDSEGRLES